MIRKFVHRAVDLVFDILTEIGATILDLGPLSVQLLKRARVRWQERRAVPGWDALLPAEAASTADVVATEDVATYDAIEHTADFPIVDTTDETAGDAMGPDGFLDSVLRHDDDRDRDLVATR